MGGDGNEGVVGEDGNVGLGGNMATSRRFMGIDGFE